MNFLDFPPSSAVIKEV